MSAPWPAALTIAGSDSSGGAGIQADLKTFSALGVYGTSAITALTAQNTLGVRGVEVASPGFVGAQIAAVLDDVAIGAIKTGMLANAAVIDAVVEALRRPDLPPLVVDPVMVATSGDRLLNPDAVDSLRSKLLPLALIVTPNLAEAAVLAECGMAGDIHAMAEQGRTILGFGCRAVLVKGGHGAGAEAIDVLVTNDAVQTFSAPRIATRNTHGTGCTLSAAIAAFLARGESLVTSVEEAKRYLSEALAGAAAGSVGHGSGPVDHLYGLRRRPS